MAFLRAIHTQRGVLTGSKIERPSRLDANHPEVGSKINAFRDFDAVKLIVASGHCPSQGGYSKLKNRRKRLSVQQMRKQLVKARRKIRKLQISTNLGDQGACPT